MAAQASEATATRFLDAIEASFMPLRHHPMLGAARGELAPDLRVVFHEPYAIYYLPLPGAIVIVRVLHGARDAAALSRRGGFDVEA